MQIHACHRVPLEAFLAEIRHFRDFSVTAQTIRDLGDVATQRDGLDISRPSTAEAAEAVTDLRHAADVLRRQNDATYHE